MKLPPDIRQQFRLAGAKGGRIAAARMTPEGRRDRALKAVAGRGKPHIEPHTLVMVHGDMLSRLHRYAEQLQSDLDTAIQLAVRAGLDALGAK